MLLPYRVDVPFDRRPVMNWFVCLAVLGVFVLQILELARFFAENPESDFGLASGAMTQFVLKGWSIRGLFGYMWLHGGLIHLLGNLIFLWLFGNAVCSKLGNLLYLPVYVGLGVFAGLAHLILPGGGLVLGASGAINGIVGMYLIFFPQNDISCFFLLLWYPVRFTLSSYWMILCWFAFDVWGLLFGTRMVAYDTHVGGFVGGFVLAIVLLKTGRVVMQRDETTLLELLRIDAQPGWRPRRPRIAAEGDNRHVGRSAAQTPAEPQPETIPFDSEPPAEVIRFICECGKKVKVPARYAGRMGKCPRCGRKLKIPPS